MPYPPPPPAANTPEDDGFDDDFGQRMCTECNGDGLRMICLDDMCHGSGECIWTRPRKNCFAVCRHCKGSGYDPE